MNTTNKREKSLANFKAAAAAGHSSQVTGVPHPHCCCCCCYPRTVRSIFSSHNLKYFSSIFDRQLKLRCPARAHSDVGEGRGKADEKRGSMTGHTHCNAKGNVALATVPSLSLSLFAPLPLQLLVALRASLFGAFRFVSLPESVKGECEAGQQMKRCSFHACTHTYASAGTSVCVCVSGGRALGNV